MGYAVKLQARSDDEWKLLWTSPYINNKNSGSSGSTLYPPGTVFELPLEATKYNLFLISCVGRMYNNNNTMIGHYNKGNYLNTLVPGPKAGHVNYGFGAEFELISPSSHSDTTYTYFGRRNHKWVQNGTDNLFRLYTGTAVVYGDATWPIYIWGISKNKQKNIENCSTIPQYTAHS